MERQYLAKVHLPAQRVPGLSHGHAHAVMLLGFEEAGCLTSGVPQRLQQGAENVNDFHAPGGRSRPVRHAHSDAVGVLLAVQKALRGQVRDKPLHGRRGHAGVLPDIAQREHRAGEGERVQDRRYFPQD